MTGLLLSLGKFWSPGGFWRRVPACRQWHDAGLINPATSACDDQQLARRVRQGDHAAFSLLVQRHHLRFYRLAYRHLLDQAAAEDLVQQCYLKYWQHPENWHPEKGVHFTTWFSRVVINACLDAHRRRKHQHQPLDEKQLTQWEHQGAISHQRDAEDNTRYHEQQQALAAAMQSLPERQRMAVNLVYYEQYSYQQGAQAMDISVSALQSLVLRAKRRLRQILGEA